MVYHALGKENKTYHSRHNVRANITFPPRVFGAGGRFGLSFVQLHVNTVRWIKNYNYFKRKPKSKIVVSSSPKTNGRQLARYSCQQIEDFKLGFENA